MISDHIQLLKQFSYYQEEAVMATQSLSNVTTTAQDTKTLRDTTAADTTSRYRMITN